MPSAVQKPLRIASASGSVTDRRYGFSSLAKHEDISFIVGDWMSEYNMTSRGGAKVNSEPKSTGEYEECFLESIIPALPDLAKRGIKVAVNAGGSDTRKLHETLTRTVKDLGLDLKIAWVEGDEVSDLLEKGLNSGNGFQSLTTGNVWFQRLYKCSADSMQERAFPSGDSSRSTLNAILVPLG